MQAKTYYGGAWYTLELDYARIATIMKDAGFRGYVSLQFEGKEDPLTAIPRSLGLLKNPSSITKKGALEKAPFKIKNPRGEPRSISKVATKPFHRLRIGDKLRGIYPEGIN